MTNQPSEPTNRGQEFGRYVSVDQLISGSLRHLGRPESSIQDFLRRHGITPSELPLPGSLDSEQRDVNSDFKLAVDDSNDPGVGGIYNYVIALENIIQTGFQIFVPPEVCGTESGKRFVKTLTLEIKSNLQRFYAHCEETQILGNEMTWFSSVAYLNVIDGGEGIAINVRLGDEEYWASKT